MVRYAFNEEKAAQAAAFIVRRHGGRMNLMALLKLLYLADRRAIIETGFSITGDRMVSMPHGPVLSRIYDAAKWGSAAGEDRVWCRYISDRAGHDVELAVADPAVSELSEYDMETLAAVDETHGKLTQFELRDFTHTLPEWKDPDGSSLPIDPVTILQAAGISAEDIRQRVLEAEEVYFLRSATGGAIA